jgi:hypothetical protein
METPRPVTAEPAEFLLSSRQAVSPFLPVQEPMIPRNALLFSSLSRLQRTPLKGGTPTSDRSLRLPSRIPLLDARPRPGSFRLRRMSSGLTARLQRKSTVCGLNGFLPSAKADGSLHLNPQPLRALAPPPLCTVLKRQLRFRFGNKNCASAHLSLQNGIQKIPGENRRRKANGPIRLKRMTAI